jgi:exodeoxyribonuclease VII small subunit
VLLRGLKNLDDSSSKDLRLNNNLFNNEEKMPKDKFEDALNKLEKIVAKLEEGDVPLEESLRLFEEGIRLSRLCNQKLDEAEKRVEILLKNKEGVLKPQPFDPSTSSGQVTSADSGEVPLAGSRRDVSEEEE